MHDVLIPTKLAQASYNLSLNGHRLKYLAMDQLDLFNYLLAFAPTIEVSASDWQDLYPESENPYRDLKRAARELSMEKIIFEGTKDPVYFCSHVRYLDGAGRIELDFSEQFLMSCF